MVKNSKAAKNSKGEVLVSARNSKLPAPVKAKLPQSFYRLGRRSSTETKIKKKAAIEAFKKSFGNITMTCQAANTNRSTFYDWMRTDTVFKAAIENTEPEELFLDFCERALAGKIADKDITAIIFALKTKGKHRGYVERTEFTGRDGKDIVIKVIRDVE